MAEGRRRGAAMQTRPQPWAPGRGLSKNRPRSQWARPVLLAGLPAALSWGCSLLPRESPSHARLPTDASAHFSLLPHLRSPAPRLSSAQLAHSFPITRELQPLLTLRLLLHPHIAEDQVGSKLYHGESFPSSLSFYFILTFFCFLATYSTGDLSSPTKDQTRDPCNGSAVS